MHFLKHILAFVGIKHQSDKYLEAVHNKFSEHVSKYGLSFGTTEEYEFRLAQFIKYDDDINKINANGDNTFVAGHNQFSSWTETEFKSMLGRKKNTSKRVEDETDIDVSTLPKSVDWRTKGAVNPVQDQARCGSCWAFASTAAIEGAHAILTGKLPKLAEQQLVDCDTRSSGCQGGLEVFAYKYAEKHAMDSEADYPYTGKDGSCLSKKKTGTVKVTTYMQPKSGSVASLKASIAKGPTTVAVDAAARPW